MEVRSVVIREASLCLRFYRSDGWTRQKVADLGPAIEAVRPRHFERWIDDGFITRSKLDPNYDSTAATYYAVYRPESEVQKLPSIEELEEMGHEVDRFQD